MTEEILTRLEWAEPHTNARGERKARCPFPDHPDTHPSCSVNVEKGVYHCFGCGRKGHIRDFASIFGIPLNGRTGKAPFPAREPKPLGRIEAEYIYEDENGAPLFRVTRHDPKDFRPSRPDGKGGWVLGLGDVRRVPYHLPKLLAAKPDEPVFIVEGEKDVHTLEDEAGLVATTFQGGAMKAAREFRPEYTEPFRGRDVVLIPDNDPAGDQDVRVKAAALSGVARRIRIVRLPDLPPKSDVTDWILAGHTIEELMSLVERTPAVASETAASTEDEDEEKPRRTSQADRLVALAFRDAILFHDQTQQAFARVKVAGHYETLRCQGRAFRRWLVRQMYEAENKVPTGEAIAAALGVLEAKAVFDGTSYHLQNRVASHDGALWYDLADERWRAVQVTPEGWQIEDEPPILFVRHEHQKPQVEPVKGGDLKRLFEYVAISDEGPKLLLMVYLVACFIPDIPHPVPVLHGPQGSGKSTVFRVLRRLIDPSAVEILSFPRDGNELVQKLSHHWAAFFDNVSTLQGWESDALCRAVTGEGFTKRQLYTDDDDVIYAFRRCVGLNGINIAATRPDLLDRSILIGLERIPPEKRRTETHLWTAFEGDRPHILGGIFDALAAAMGILPEVRLSTYPRMADFAEWGVAIARALGYTQEDFLRAYDTNIREQNEEVLQGHPVAAAVRALMEGRDTWGGTPSELLDALSQIADGAKIDTRIKGWPRAAHVLTRRLNEVRPNLLDAGIFITTEHSGSRTITIRKEGGNSVQTVQTVQKSAAQALADGRYPDAIESSVQIPSARNSLSPNGGDATDALDATFPFFSGDAQRHLETL
jgi:hypothetical protein